MEEWERKKCILLVEQTSNDRFKVTTGDEGVNFNSTDLIPPEKSFSSHQPEECFSEYTMYQWGCKMGSSRKAR